MSGRVEPSAIPPTKEIPQVPENPCNARPDLGSTRSGKMWQGYLFGTANCTEKSGSRTTGRPAASTSQPSRVFM